jgi:Protein of unknown function (DUF3684).
MGMSLHPTEELLRLAFYQTLGSRKLSMHVREDYQVTAEIIQSKRASDIHELVLEPDIHELVLERLPLFLYEHTHSRTKVSINWLSNPSNFIVKTFGKIAVSRQLHFSDLRLSKSHEVSAVAKRQGSGPIQLWVAGNSQVDMYE